jgi:hypothetical protein
MDVANVSRATLEVISALGIVLGLVFVGLELRHANSLAQADALISLNETTATIVLAKYEAPASDQLWALYSEGGISDGKELSPQDREILTSYWTALINVYEAAWKFRQTGILGDEEVNPYLLDLCNVFSRSRLSTEFWLDSRGFYSPSFVVDAEGACPALLL